MLPPFSDPKILFSERFFSKKKHLILEEKQGWCICASSVKGHLLVPSAPFISFLISFPHSYPIRESFRLFGPPAFRNARHLKVEGLSFSFLFLRPLSRIWTNGRAQGIRIIAALQETITTEGGRFFFLLLVRSERESGRQGNASWMIWWVRKKHRSSQSTLNVYAGELSAHTLLQALTLVSHPTQGEGITLSKGLGHQVKQLLSSCCMDLSTNHSTYSMSLVLKVGMRSHHFSQACRAIGLCIRPLCCQQSAFEPYSP